MGMSIRTTIFPIRARYGDREPWELIVEVKNEDPQEKNVSVTIQLPEAASFSTVGLTDKFEKQIEAFRPSATIQLKMPVYQSNSADVGAFTGKVIVEEHPHGFQYAGRKVSKEIPFKIVG